MASSRKTTQKTSVVSSTVEALNKPVDTYPVPSYIRVMGRQVPVKKLGAGKVELDGEFDSNKLEIYYKESLTPVEKMDTLLHEVLHAIDHWVDLELSERQVRVLASCLIGLFQEDPDFAKFVTRPMKAIE